MKTKLAVLGLIGTALFATPALAGMAQAVKASNQSVSGGYVVADEIHSNANGWLVVHRTDAANKPGPVVGHAPLRKGVNKEVVAILTEKVSSGDKLMLMLHGERGGNKTGIFEYSLGAKEDGPVKVDGKLVMTVITAQ